MDPLLPRLADLDEGATYDVVVVGAGGAGMAAALFAAIDGARVLLLESTRHVGGSTAWSRGLVWVPGTRHDVGESTAAIDAARRYLVGTVGSHGDARVREAFLRQGAVAIDRLERESMVSWFTAPHQPDHHPEVDGARPMGRVLGPMPFDARLLGDAFSLLRSPPPESLRLQSSAFGGVMLDVVDAMHLERWRRSLRSLHHVSKLVTRVASDRLHHPRGTRLLHGNALVGQLLASLRQRKVEILMPVVTTELTEGPLGIDGLTVVQDGQIRRIRSRGGVILATGGFNRHPMQRGARLPDIEAEWCVAAPGPSGMGLSLAEGRGAVFGTGSVAAAYLVPVSLRRRRDGTTAAYPHLGRRRRQVFVDADGDCGIDAGTPHHAAALAIHDSMTMPVHLVTDARGMQEDGLGLVGPQGYGLAAARADGYIRQAADLRGLADVLQVPAATLERQLRRHLAKAYADTERVHFSPPYYAVEVVPGDMAAASGLATDECARVLDARRQPLSGLYAVGGDMHSMMGGVLPAPGCMLGPGLVFAAIAAADAVARAGRGRTPVSSRQTVPVAARSG